MNPFRRHTSVGKNARLIITSSSLVTALGCLVLVPIAFSDEPLSSLVVGISMAYAIWSFLLHPTRSIWQDPFHPAIALKALIFIGYFPGVLRLILPPKSVSPDIIFQTAMVGLYFIIAIDIMALVLPNFHKQEPALPPKFSPKRKVATFFVAIYILGWIWRLYALRQGLLYGTLLATQLELTPYSNAVGILNKLGFLALIGIGVFAKSSRLIIPVAILEIGWAAIAGSKGAVLQVAIPLLVILYQRRIIKEITKLRFRTILTGAILGLLVVLSFSFVDAYRAASQRIIMYEGLARFSPMRALREVQFSKVFRINSAKLINRSTLLSTHFAYLLEADHLKELKRWSGESLLPLITWFIPRAIWPGKPQVSRGRWYATEILGWSFGTRSEAAITLWGDAYMNFGWAGVFLVSLTWIAITFFIYEFSVSKRPWGLVFLGTVYMHLLALEQNIAVPLVNIMQTGLLVMLLYFVSRLFKVKFDISLTQRRLV